MSQFIQLHLLTAYPPSNLNRDDLGRPKTAIVGGFERLRVSSQSLKRAWRTSEVFSNNIKGNQGSTTRRIGYNAAKKMVEEGVSQKDAITWGKQISCAFVNSKDLEAEKKDDLFTPTIFKLPVRLSYEEVTKVDELVSILSKEKRPPSDDELDILRKTHKSLDIAMFGRMLASKGKPNVNMEAAVQVAHAFTVNSVKIDDDFFTAVEDLNEFKEDEGSAFMGDAGFGSGVYYLYICINKTLLIENLQGDEDLANTTLSALVEAVAKVAPTGKQNSFASRAYTSYLLAESGSQQPRSLSVSFFKPIKGDDQIGLAISELESQREKLETVYGACADKKEVMNAQTGEGTLQKIIDMVVGA